ncbi:MAG TPA: molecular chaperone DnaJ [Oligoflexia bacterium]|nr:molecular chaperone DnaJ [Oligoflexia bacterium]HMP26715.1 molecular chaperone DnaJ [Oligoflexia bacterium]
MKKRDYYEVLGVSRDASQEDIKKAYRKLAVQYHPDKNPGDKKSEELFKEATEAYSVLGDEQARKKYDTFGHEAFSGGAGSAAGGFQGFADFSDFEDLFGDIFGSFFGGAMGGRSRSGRGRSGRDLRFDLRITFEEAAFGAEKELSIQKRVSCVECLGSGVERGSSKEVCKECRGSGQTRIQQGFFTLARTCSACGGSGEKITKPCRSCRGEGLKFANVKLNVKIPAGINDGQRLKLRGEGEEGVGGGRNGDLYVEIAVDPHPFFRREDSNLICDLSIPYTTAVLGGEIEVPTLEGKERLKIPAGTESGKAFKVRGGGVQELGTNRRGDLYIKVNIHIPKKVSGAHLETLNTLKKIELEELAKSSSNKGFFSKVKGVFN